jgi:transcriptional regulator with XRE-family HTH domain
MPRNFDDLKRQLDEELVRHPEGEQIREQVQRELDAELAAHAVSLQELRRARAMTQNQLAAALDVSQAQVSRIEKQADLLLSTLASYVEAMGGELELVARFPDHPPAYLTIGEIIGTERPDTERPVLVELDRVDAATLIENAVKAALEGADRIRAETMLARSRAAAGIDPTIKSNP